MKMAEKYLHLVTSQLRPVVEHVTGSWKWENLGTTAQAINLDDIDGANTVSTPDNEIHYILPIMDELKCTHFRIACEGMGLPSEVLTHEQALTKWEELKAQKISETL